MSRRRCAFGQDWVCEIAVALAQYKLRWLQSESCDNNVRRATVTRTERLMIDDHHVQHPRAPVLVACVHVHWALWNRRVQSSYLLPLLSSSTQTEQDYSEAEYACIAPTILQITAIPAELHLLSLEQHGD